MKRPNRQTLSSFFLEQVHYATSTTPTRNFQRPHIRPITKSWFFCGSKTPHPREKCPAQGQTCNYYHKLGHFSSVCQQAARDQRSSRPPPRKPIMPSPRREHVRMVDQDESSAFPSEDGMLYEHCFTISNTKPHKADESSTVPYKGHFVLLDLKSPDSNHTIQVPFQIDSAASCNTLPSKHLSSMPWATVIPTRTVIIPYASPPIQPIGQTTIETCKDNTTCNLTFQVTDTDQPALLQKPAKRLEYLPSTPITLENAPLPLHFPKRRPTPPYVIIQQQDPPRYLQAISSKHGPN